MEYPGVNGVGTRLSQLVHDHEGTLSPGSRVIVRVGAAMRGAAVIEGVERGDPAWNQLGVFLAVGMLATLVGVIEAAG